MRRAPLVTAQAASSTRKGSIGSRKRGVSTLTNTTLSAISTGIAHTQPGVRRAARVKAPARASVAITQNAITPVRATSTCMPTASADACHAGAPSSSSIRTRLCQPALSGAVRWSPT
jgi:hypothetical protein